MNTVYDDKIKVLEFWFYNYSEYLGKNIRKGNKINLIGQESIKTIMEELK